MKKDKFMNRFKSLHEADDFGDTFRDVLKDDLKRESEGHVEHLAFAEEFDYAVKYHTIDDPDPTHIIVRTEHMRISTLNEWWDKFVIARMSNAERLNYKFSPKKPCWSEEPMLESASHCPTASTNGITIYFNVGFFWSLLMGYDMDMYVSDTFGAKNHFDYEAKLSNELKAKGYEEKDIDRELMKYKIAAFKAKDKTGDYYIGKSARYVLTHELFHGIFSHLFRESVKPEIANGKFPLSNDANRWFINVCMDIEINEIIESTYKQFKGLTAIIGGQHDAKYKGHTWEYIFDDKLKSGEQPKKEEGEPAHIDHNQTDILDDCENGLDEIKKLREKPEDDDDDMPPMGPDGPIPPDNKRHYGRPKKSSGGKQKTIDDTHNSIDMNKGIRDAMNDCRNNNLDLDDIEQRIKDIISRHKTQNYMLSNFDIDAMLSNSGASNEDDYIRGLVDGYRRMAQMLDPYKDQINDNQNNDDNDSSTSSGSSSPSRQAKEAAQNAKKAASNAQQAANQAQQAAEQAQQNAQMSGNSADQQAAQQAQQNAQQAQQNADKASQAAQQAQQASQAAQQAEKNGNMSDAKSAASQAQQNASNAQQSASQAQQNASNAQQSASQGLDRNSPASQAQKSANNAQNSANAAQQKANQAQQSANQAQQSANQAQAKADQSGKASDQQAANKAQQAAHQAQKTANQAQNNANKAQQAANNAQQAANEASEMQMNGNMNAANQSAKQAKQSADDALKSAQQSTDPMQSSDNASQAQNSANQAQRSANKAQNNADQAMKNAEQAQQKADAAQQKANQSGSSTDRQDAQNAQNAANQAQNAADKAQDAANKAQNAADKAQDAANDASNAQSDGDNNSAKQSANDARQQAQQAQQAAKESEDANNSSNPAGKAQDAATKAQESANKAQQNAQQARRNADAAKQNAEKAQQQAEQSGDPSDQQAAQQAQQNAQQAQQNADNAQQAANEAKNAADKAQQNANDASQAQSKGDMQSAQQSAQQAQQNAQQAQQAAEQSEEASQQSDPANQAQQSADNAQRSAEHAQQQAEDAQNVADQAQQQAEQTGDPSDQQAAQQAQQAADKAKQAAEKAQQAAEKAQQAADQADQAQQNGDMQSAQQQAQQAKQAEEEAKRASEEARKNKNDIIGDPGEDSTNQKNDNGFEAPDQATRIIKRHWDTGDLISMEEGKLLEDAARYKGPQIDPINMEKTLLKKSQDWYKSARPQLGGSGKGDGESSHLLELLEQTIDPKNFAPVTDWKDLLQQFLLSLDGRKYYATWRGRDLMREYFVKKNNTPTFLANGLPSIIYAVDNSGSMGGQLLTKEEMRLQICTDIWNLDRDCEVDNSALCNFCSGTLTGDDIITWSAETEKDEVWQNLIKVREPGGTDILGTLVALIKTPEIYTEINGQLPLIVVFTDNDGCGNDWLKLPSALQRELDDNLDSNPDLAGITVEDIFGKMVVVMINKNINNVFSNWAAISDSGTKHDIIGLKSLLQHGMVEDQLIFVDTSEIKEELEQNR